MVSWFLPRHSSHTAGVEVPVGDISGSTSLHHCHHADIFLGIGEQDCSAVLYNGPHHGEIGS